MGLRNFFKRILPHHHAIKEHKHLQVLGEILHDPNIFHLTRRSTAGGAAVGLFFAFLPIPGQMLVSALVAIYLRLNLPLAVILVWITNPITIPPILFLAYETGAFILNEPSRQIAFEFSAGWLSEKLIHIWQPLLVGCLSFSIAASVTGYFTIRLLWRLAIVRKWEERRQAQLKKENAKRSS